jgi:hypothetical protein
MIEGLPSVLLAIAIFFALPSRPDKSRYLTEPERTIVHTRLNSESLGVIAIMYSSMNLTLGSVTGFLPTIIKGYAPSSF